MIRSKLGGFEDLDLVFEAVKFPIKIDELVTELKPALPLYVMHNERLRYNAINFTRLFPGKAMYATKCNPDKTVIKTLYNNGVKAFDVASIEEVKLVHAGAPEAKLYFMHPVKSAEAIEKAYFSYGVRAFVFDTQEEMYKIMRATEFATDLELFVRIALPKNDSAKIDFASKFGAAPEDAAQMLADVRNVSVKLGLSFHVGTQTMDPAVYSRAIKYAAEVIDASGVKVDVLDIGGGFPASYVDEEPVDLDIYMNEISAAIKTHGLEDMELMAEPGRVLVASTSSLIVRVEQRRGSLLYINDGIYGGLFDAGPQLNTRYPVKIIRNGDRVEAEGLEPFSFAGPTCDSLDMMQGPFMLPDDIKEGDWIEIQNIGAYSQCFHGGDFNGMGKSMSVNLIGTI